MAITANVFYNLSAWASATYSVGNRVSNAGNAYQCITAGSSTAAPTGSGSNINNGGTAHWKWLAGSASGLAIYTSLTAWQSDTTNFPLVLTQPYIVHLWNTTAIGGSSPTITTTLGTAFFTLQGHTTTTTNTITIACAPGESIRDTLANQTTALAFNANNGVSFTLPTGSGAVNYFDVEDANTIIDGLQFLDPASGSNSTILNFGQPNVVLSNCLFDGYAQSGGSAMVGGYQATGSLKAYNVIIIDRGPASNSGAQAITFYQTTMTCANLTVISINSSTGSAGIGNYSTSGTMTAKNCISLGYDSSGCFSSPNGATTTVSYSLVSAASFASAGITAGSGNLYNETAANQFVSSTDFRLLATANAVNAGTTDTTDIPSADDIARTARPQGSAWDIGCWEYKIGRPLVIWLD